MICSSSIFVSFPPGTLKDPEFREFFAGTSCGLIPLVSRFASDRKVCQRSARENLLMINGEVKLAYLVELD